MRVLLDECVPRALCNEIRGHEVQTVAEVDWAGVKNGELLRLAATMPTVLDLIPQAKPGVVTHVRGE